MSKIFAALMEVAAALRDRGHGANVSYSRKVFIPLTRLCRDSCHYCTFAHLPRRNERAYLTPDEVLAIARAGADAGCKEALFTLGDKPELRYRAAREELDRLGHASTISYLSAMAALVLEETGLLPHLNPGVMTAAEIAALRDVSVSQGLMLEPSAERLSRRGGPHFGSPDKLPGVRLDTIRAAGEAAVPFTSGILIGIGETRARAHRGAACCCAICIADTAICRRSSSRISAPSPARGWRGMLSPRSTSSSGPSRSRASCSAPT